MPARTVNAAQVPNISGEMIIMTKCPHIPSCAPADSVGHASARVVAAHPEQGWSLLCNGVIHFSDGGEILPEGRAIPAPASIATAR